MLNRYQNAEDTPTAQIPLANIVTEIELSHSSKQAVWPMHDMCTAIRVGFSGRTIFRRDTGTKVEKRSGAKESESLRALVLRLEHEGRKGKTE